MDKRKSGYSVLTIYLLQDIGSRNPDQMAVSLTWPKAAK